MHEPTEPSYSQSSETDQSADQSEDPAETDVPTDQSADQSSPSESFQPQTSDPDSQSSSGGRANAGLIAGIVVAVVVVIVIIVLVIILLLRRKRGPNSDDGLGTDEEFTEETITSVSHDTDHHTLGTEWTHTTEDTAIFQGEASDDDDDPFSNAFEETEFA